MLRRHHEGIFVEEQANECGKHGNRQRGRESDHQRERDDMSKCDAAPPVVIAEASMGHFAGGEHGCIRGEGIEFARESQQ